MSKNPGAETVQGREDYYHKIPLRARSKCGIMCERLQESGSRREALPSVDPRLR
jgi:hypothetical protein